jgi:hypothetical protein
MMSLATTTTMTTNMNTRTYTSTGRGAGAYARPPVSGFSLDVGVDAHTQCMEAAAAAAAASRRASGVQVRSDFRGDLNRK